MTITTASLILKININTYHQCILYSYEPNSVNVRSVSKLNEMVLNLEKKFSSTLHRVPDIIIVIGLRLNNSLHRWVPSMGIIDGCHDLVSHYESRLKHSKMTKH